MPPIFPNSRKLLPPIMSDESPHFAISPSTNSHSSKITEEKETENPNNSSGVSCCGYNNLTLNPPFDSAMALTVLVLLTALFFMGFFSIYIRRFSDESSVDPARRRSRNATTTSYQPRLRGSVKGVDPATIESLPVHVYSGGVEKQEINTEKMELECAICLSEFEEKDCVKEIPYCGHVFHVECIDTWLLSHVTCPLCRTAKLFPVEEKNEVEGEGHVACGEEEGSGVTEVHENDESETREVRLMVEMSDTWRDEEHEVDGLSVTRTTECSVNGDRAVNLHRSLSF